MDKQQLNQFKQELRYYTGSDQFYRHCYGQGVYTEGVRFMAEKLEAFWLLDMIFIYQQQKIVAEEAFQVWKLKVHEDDSADLVLEDGDHQKVKLFQIPFTDFPLEEFTLWLVNKTLMLPSEY